MRVGLIPPISLLPEYGKGNLHLLLAHLFGDDRYRDHYRSERRRGAHLIVDNSAHEKGEGIDSANLLDAAHDVLAQEIVVPDVLFNTWSTIQRAKEAHGTWLRGKRKLRRQFSKLDPTLMYVPQGNFPEQWAECLWGLCQLHSDSVWDHSIRKGFSIGVSKDYEAWEGGLPFLFGKHLVPARRRYGFNVHLLGWGRNLADLTYLRRKYPWVRSIDSAKPFVYGLNEMEIHLNKVAEYPGRPINYFFMDKFTEEMKRCMQYNIAVLQRAAQ
ncbi:MAG TPA: hypothetical protein VH593_05025 [Ktedonobacteraceae bacterium]|jgi:hypothetical protein